MVDSTLSGRSFAATAPFEVTDEHVASFAAATGTPYQPGDPAPATYPIVIAFAAMQQLMSDPTVGIELHHVVHGQQKFTYERPVRVGDRLVAELTVTGLRRLAGTDIIATSSRITDEHGELVCVASATLVHKES